jgi:hypothetical protein
MSCVLYKDGETLFCDPADMARETAAGWSVTDPNRDTPDQDEVVNEKANKETIKDSEKPKTGQTEADEEQGERKKILGIL